LWPTPPPGTSPTPIPSGAQATAQAYAASHGSQLAASCQATQGTAAWAYLDGLVGALRATDPRWGYVCVSGTCANPSGDVIAFLGSGASPVPGARGTWGVDVIVSHCGPMPTASWNVLGYDPAGVWTGSRMGF